MANFYQHLIHFNNKFMKYMTYKMSAGIWNIFCARCCCKNTNMRSFYHAYTYFSLAMTRDSTLWTPYHKNILAIYVHVLCFLILHFNFAYLNRPSRFSSTLHFSLQAKNAFSRFMIQNLWHVVYCFVISGIFISLHVKASHFFNDLILFLQKYFFD